VRGDDWGDPHFRSCDELPGDRRELTAAHIKWAESDAAEEQLIRPYRGRYGAIQRGFQFKPGFLYTQVRAIAARINQNFDGWPSGELKKSYRTFLGKPCFVNHQNFDPAKARGKVIAARYIENGRDKYVDVIQEIDAQRFPKLAHEIKTGGMDSVSMGVEAGFTICSYCGNKAVDEDDFCSHVKYHKGRILPRINAKTGAHEDVLVYEKCHKLGFFELSFVFDPADETAVVSRVLSASRTAQAPAEQIPGEMQTYSDFPYVDMPSPMMPQASRRRAYGEAEQPDDDCFCTCEDHHHDDPEWEEQWRDTGEEAPEDIDTLRDDDESEGEDSFKHYVESPKELRGPDLDQTKRLDRAQEQEGLDADRRVEDVENVEGVPMPRTGRRTRRSTRMSTLVDPRTGRRFVAADELPPEVLQALMAGGGGGGAPMPMDDGGGGFPPPDDGGFPPEDEGDFPPSDEGDEFPEDEFGGEDEDDYGDEGDEGDEGEESDEDLIEEAEEDLEQAEGEEGYGEEEEYPEEGEDEFGGEEYPEDEEEEGPPPEFLARRHGNRRTSYQKKRRARKGTPMSLAARNRVASVGRRRHYADDSGHFDSGPYGEDNQGQQEDVFISQTPGTEPVADPTPGDGTISNTEKNLVARIQARNNEQRRDLIAYEQITGRRIRADGHATENPDEVNPTVNTGPGGEEQTGDDFESLALDNEETQPKNASLAPFKAFNTWLYQTTGRQARQHGNATFLRRQAARFCQASGYSVESLFPAMGMVLREIRANQGRTAMRRYADDKLDVAAPQDRIDVEQPVSDTTDADAQASQFGLSDFGGNAGDNLADPNLDTDSQIWAPGEKPAGFKSSNRKADGITAVRYAEAFIEAGLAPNTPEEKWKLAGLAQTMRHGTIVDRIRLLDAVNTVHQASRRRTAGVSGAGRGIPQGFGGRQLTAGVVREAANDIATDSAIFLK
jgi:hypothetical protein